MKNKFIHIIRKKPVFLFLLPVFFVWHGFVDFYDLISPSKALVLALYYLAGTIVVFLLSWLLLRNKSKAAVYSFFLMCLYFFFGSLQDLLQKKIPGAFINKYSFILPVLFVLFIFLFIVLKTNKNQLTKTFTYLNALILILVLFDLGLYLKKVFINYNILTIGKPLVLQPCEKCLKPDIYLILADGYSGKTALLRFFQYDNSGFEYQLKKRNFFVADSSIANYNYTVFSMGSMFNMDYLKTASSFEGKTDLPIAFKAVRKSRLIKFLENEQYDILNYSIFDIDSHPALALKTLKNFDRNPIPPQTFLYRLNRDIGYHLITTFKLKFLIRKERISPFDNLDNNLKLELLTRDIVLKKSSKPKFVYTHLVMPHWPYYFDSAGNRIPASQFNDSFNYNKAVYISYLKFTNKKLLDLIDHIQKNNSRPAIILLMSDHGFREREENESQDPDYLNRYQFVNLNAVFFPDQNYTGFYKGISNINQFRVILNSQFNQHLELLRDSSIIVIRK